jgi:hypothetical protein
MFKVQRLLFVLVEGLIDAAFELFCGRGLGEVSPKSISLFTACFKVSPERSISLFIPDGTSSSESQ